MAIDISGLYFFMPVFSFLFVFIIVFALLKSSKLLGDVPFANFFISFIMAIIFISFSSLEFYVRNIIPWVAVLIVIIFLVLLVVGFATKDFWIFLGNKLAWVSIGLLVLIFLIAAIKVFNPIIHPDLGITSGEGISLFDQLREAADSTVVGSLLLIIIAAIVAWVITKK